MRKCNECILCCLVLEISPLKKAANEPCKFCDKGCKIYDERPEPCKDFECLWLKDKSIPDNLRPDRCGVVFEKLGDYDTCLALVDPKRQNAWRSKEVLDQMHKLANDGKAVVVSVGKRPVLLPNGKTIKDVWRDIREFVKEVGVSK